MHKLLERQLNKRYGSLAGVPPEFLEFLETVSKTYADFEREYILIERSLSISSKESQELNASLRAEAKAVKTHTAEVERFNRFTIDRELKMIELKREIEQLKRGGTTPAGNGTV